MGKFSSGDDDVFEADFSKVLDVLGGPSPWQQYILFNLKIVRASLASRTFKVDTADEFAVDVKKLIGTSINAFGLTDKWTGTILLKEREEKTRASYLLAALHECVHLVSDPVSQCAQASTAHHFLKNGLLEGLVEVVTEDILSAQNLALPSDEWRGHQQRLPIVRELLRTAGVPLLACLLFQGFSAGFNEKMTCIYGSDNWEAIRNMATLNMTDRALDRMRTSAAAQQSNSRRK